VTAAGIAHNYAAAAAAGNCNTGTWQQKWQCGWNQPTTGAANAGAFAGHNVLPWLLVLVIVILAVRAVKKRKRDGSPAPARAARR
jgi:hypothetical protein